jgi:hypothetical protein
MAYGTLSVADLLASVRVGATVYEVGEDRTFETIKNYMDAHNQIQMDMMTDLVEPTTERIVGTGGVDTMTMDELDEFGRADAQKVTAGNTLGFPLRKYGGAIQWTRSYFEEVTLDEFVAQVDAMLTADSLNIQKQIKRAIFLSSNYTFTDKFKDRMSIPVKRLVNADSFPLPTGPNGETFTASSHTHYVARVSTLAASDVTAIISNVAEHYNSDAVRLYINQAQEAAIRGFTTNFTAYVDARIIPASTAQVARGTLDQTNVYDRAIGIFDQAEVIVKPWVPANYMLATVVGPQKPLAFRTRRAGSGGFGLDYENESYPLRARQYGREFGIGVWNRVNGAVLYTGGTSYTDPTIT